MLQPVGARGCQGGFSHSGCTKLLDQMVAPKPPDAPVINTRFPDKLNIEFLPKNLITYALLEYRQSDLKKTSTSLGVLML